MKLSKHQEWALINIAYGSRNIRNIGLQTLWALERRGLVQPGRDLFNDQIVYWKDAQLTPDGWVAALPLLQDHIDFIWDNVRRNGAMYGWEPIIKWFIALSRAEWHAGTGVL